MQPAFILHYSLYNHDLNKCCICLGGLSTCNLSGPYIKSSSILVSLQVRILLQSPLPRIIAIFELESVILGQSNEFICSFFNDAYSVTKTI
jgi:hypothetical protein